MVSLAANKEAWFPLFAQEPGQCPPVQRYRRQLGTGRAARGLLINLALVGNLARLEQRLWFVKVDTLLIILSFVGGMMLLYPRRVGL